MRDKEFDVYLCNAIDDVNWVALQLVDVIATTTPVTGSK